ncbi:MAG: response regulator transcription factor [Acidimicrobiales bacterium]
MLYPLSYEGRESGPEAGEGLQPRMVAVPGATVLAVDDEPGIRELLRVTLESDDYRVITASDGVEGLARARSERPAVMVLDVMMPRMNGLEVTRALKSDEATSSIPILLLSARAQAADLRAGDASGADDYLTKPFDPIELLERVARLIRGTG